MNFTDVDDKIIKRARSEFLYERYTKRDEAQRLEIARAAVADAKSRGIAVPVELPTESDTAILEPIIGPYLDASEGRDIDFKHDLLLNVTQRFEKRFLEDMQTLNVMEPDVIVRVTESMQAIVDFIQRIKDNGFAYETSDGSVYFDITAFEAAGHRYARLEPTSRNNAALAQEGEGSLTAKTSEKKSEGDFALWKASKPGEPIWPNPHGTPGRPGWHIECSAMASAEFGESMDIHSGGIDLAFPHHDNELAQSEAYWSRKDAQGRAIDSPWVQSFMHMGHLNIKGAKMSKSLKNFTTIRNALSRGDYTPRSLRIIFLSSSWRDSFEISDGAIEWASGWESTVDVLFVLAQNLFWQQQQQQVHKLAGANGSTPQSHSTAIENALGQAKKGIEAALRDSFNTREALEVIARLANSVHATVQKDGPADAETIISVARYVTQLIQIFGLVPNVTEPQSEQIGWEGTGIADVNLAGVRRVGEIRAAIRSAAMAAKGGQDPIPILKDFHFEAKADPALVGSEWASTIDSTTSIALGIRNGDFKNYLGLSDSIRDAILWDAGYYLEDTQYHSLPFLMRPLRASDKLARNEAEARAQAKEAAKARKATEDAQRAAEEAERAKVDPLMMFRSRTGEFSEWDESGIPIKRSSGEEVPKNQMKKLKKEQDAQRKLFEKFQKLNM